MLETKELKMLTNNFYHVQSESQNDVFYEVSNGVCSCVSGMQGAFCKHQAAVLLKYKVSFPNSPELSVENKREFCYIATGKDCIRSSFLDPMMPATSSDKRVKEATDCRNYEIPEEAEEIDAEKNISTTENRKKEASEKFGAIMKNLTSIIENEENVDLDIVEKFLEKASNVQSASDLNNLLNPFSTMHRKPTRVGRKIKVQPTSIARRKSFSRGSLVCRAGRPRQGIVKSTKRLHLLNRNIEANCPNAKSHGEGH